MSGASHLWGEIEAGDARFDASGTSEVTLSGSAGDVIVDARDASTVDLADFPVADANVETRGSSKVTVNPNGILDADASDASHVYYVGNPRLGSWDASGGSFIERK